MYKIILLTAACPQWNAVWHLENRKYFHVETENNNGIKIYWNHGDALVVYIYSFKIMVKSLQYKFYCQQKV